MAAVESVRKNTTPFVTSAGYITQARTVHAVIDFDNVEASLASGDHLNVFTLPKGTIVLAVGLEQLAVGPVTNTLVARIGSTTTSATLAGNAAVGTVTAQAAVDTQILTAPADVNVLAAAAARGTGKVRVFAVVIDGLAPTQVAMEVDRDTLA
jgi:hypothetical protein